MSALLPCPNPWCEGPEREGDFSPVVGRRQFGNWSVGCSSCPMDGPIRRTEAEAITAWNTRANQLAVVPSVEVIAGCIENCADSDYRRAADEIAEAIHNLLTGEA